ncbi:hypothetical protein GCK32_015327 [Trichostrongylus colubriformis]|uniref:Uncharacterized protein n=1 Tax=Trichostrongylus colubriformis TaxID=6319 RepID=A0AAN8J0F4_TRICO
MPISANLEERLQRELERKIKIVESSRARPSEELIQQRIVNYGNECYDTVSIVQQARYEYSALMQDKYDLFNKRGGAFHYLVKLKQMHGTHKRKREEVTTATELFVLAHEWYEILVTVGEVEELSRLDFLRKLGEEEYLEPTEPGDRNYPEPNRVHRSYERKNVTDMVKYQLIAFDVLLEEEKIAVERAEAETHRTAALEDETMRQLRESFLDLQDEIRRQTEETTEWMHTMRNQCASIMKQCVKTTECSKAVMEELKKVTGHRKISVKLTACAEDCRQLSMQVGESARKLTSWMDRKDEDDDLENPTLGRKRKFGDIEMPRRG